MITQENFGLKKKFLVEDQEVTENANVSPTKKNKIA